MRNRRVETSTAEGEENMDAREPIPMSNSGTTWNPDHVFPRSGLLKYFLGKFILWVLGWKTTGHFPKVPRAVIIAHPHTSYWDLPIMLSAAWVHRVQFNWFGKHTLFENPITRWFFTSLGGIAVDRRAPQGLVGQASEQIRTSESMILAVPPAGQRAARDFWKSGFYYIALLAKVPICCGCLDFAKKEASPGLTFYPTGNVKKDMDVFREFYKDKRGKWPDDETRIYMKDEAKYDEDGNLRDGEEPAYDMSKL